ncbi:MAG: Beta-galactosidase [Anaerolineales bacterium]|nr:Beta-galactosidase [Anaerolineales bacterium]
MTLTVSSSQFLLNGQPFRILSGAIHYFRVVPEYWRDRLAKMKAFGLNTVETYAAWNLHEPRPGQFHFDGMLDIVKFVETAGDLGLKVIVRPGPYICSEWDFGGLPSWLLKDPHMQVRCAYPPYLAAVDRFFDALLPRLAPLQSTRGGPIIAMQVENEYGSYGNDKIYLRHLADTMRARH